MLNKHLLTKVFLFFFYKKNGPGRA